MEQQTLTTIIAGIILILLQDWRARRTERTAKRIGRQAKIAARKVSETAASAANDLKVHTSAQAEVIKNELTKNGGDSVKDKVDQAAKDSTTAVVQNQEIISQNEGIIERIKQVEIIVARFICHQAKNDLARSKLLEEEAKLIEQMKVDQTPHNDESNSPDQYHK